MEETEWGHAIFQEMDEPDLEDIDGELANDFISENPIIDDHDYALGSITDMIAKEVVIHIGGWLIKKLGGDPFRNNPKTSAKWIQKIQREVLHVLNRSSLKKWKS